jgi:hypothetical protein
MFATLMLSGSLLLWQATLAVAESPKPTCPTAPTAGAAMGAQTAKNDKDEVTAGENLQVEERGQKAEGTESNKNDGAMNDKDEVTAGENLQVEEDGEKSDLDDDKDEGDKNETEAAAPGTPAANANTAACKTDDKNEKTGGSQQGSTTTPKKP